MSNNQDFDCRACDLAIDAFLDRAEANADALAEHLKRLKPSIVIEDGNHLYDVRISIKARRKGVTIKPSFIPELEAFMAAVEAAVEMPS